MQKDIIPQDSSPEFGRDFVSVINALHSFAGTVSKATEVQELNALWEILKTLESVTGAYMAQQRFTEEGDEPNFAARAADALHTALSFSLQLVAARMWEASAGSDQYSRNLRVEVLLNSIARWGADPKYIAEQAAMLAE